MFQINTAVKPFFDNAPELDQAADFVFYGCA
jgi:hypothetical protein